MKYRVSGSHLSVRMIISAISGYSFFIASSLIFILLFPPLMLLLIWNIPLRQTVAVLIFRSYNRFLTRIWLPMFGVYKIREQSGFEKIRRNTPAIFVANHRSRLDGPLLIPLLPNTGIIIKSTYARSPLFQSLVRYLDFVSIDPHSIESLSDAMEQCKKILADGKRLLIFPEGTRATSSRTKTFKDLAFRLALETGLPVIPVVVHTDWPVMAKIRGSHTPAHRMTLTIRALPPQYGSSGERPVEFADRVRKMLIRKLRQLDSGTVWEELQPSTETTSRHRNAGRKVHLHPSAAPQQQRDSA